MAKAVARLTSVSTGPTGPLSSPLGLVWDSGVGLTGQTPPEGHSQVCPFIMHMSGPVQDQD